MQEEVLPRSNRHLKPGPQLRVQEVAPTHKHDQGKSKEGERFPRSSVSPSTSSAWWQRQRAPQQYQGFCSPALNVPLSHLPQNKPAHLRVAPPKCELVLPSRAAPTTSSALTGSTQVPPVLFPQPPSSPQNNCCLKVAVLPSSASRCQEEENPCSGKRGVSQVYLRTKEMEPSVQARWLMQSLEKGLQKILWTSPAS